MTSKRSRRAFVLQSAGGLSGAWLWSACGASRGSQSGAQSAEKPQVPSAAKSKDVHPASQSQTGATPSGSLHILVLGGTGFLGPHVVERALSRGHKVTLFNRGKTQPHLFPELEKLRGDRKSDLSALDGRRFDAVIDTSGYIPKDVTVTARKLQDSGQYLFVSSVSAYAETNVSVTEDSPLAVLTDPNSEDVRRDYGPLKAACERAAEHEMPGKTIVIRPGLIVGPGDPTDRFTYWPVRVARGGDVLAPGTPADPIQSVDVRDLAAFMVLTLEKRAHHAYNVAGPGSPLTIGGLLHSCKEISKSDANFRFVSAEKLEELGVSGWTDMPIWVPPTSEGAGLLNANIDRAVALGLKHRPIETTIRDTLAYWNSLPAERTAKLRAGIDPAREAEILKSLAG